MTLVGVDLGGTNIKIGLVENGTLQDSRTVETDAAGGYEAILSTICREIALLANGRDVERIGIGSPGLIDSAEGTVLYSNNIAWERAPLARDVSRLTGKPVAIVNDAKAAALAEALYGAGRGYESCAMFTLGTGVGGGYVERGALKNGRSGADFLFGHIGVAAGGRRCTCGRYGCLEAYASGTALMKRAKAVLKRRSYSMILNGDRARNGFTVKDIFDACVKGDPTAKELVEEFIGYLSSGVVSVCNVLRPEVVVLGGGIAGAGAMLTEPVQKRCEEELFGYGFAPVKVALAELGNRAGMIGAAAYAAQQTVTERK